MWTKFNGYGAPGATDAPLATDASHSGKMSLKSDSIHRGQARAQRDLMALGATACKHWGRIFYKVQQPSPPPQKTATNTVIHITWTSLVGPGGENRVVELVENMKGAHQWLFNIPSDKCCTSSGYDWEFDDAWHCAEWWVDVSTNSYDLVRRPRDRRQSNRLPIAFARFSVRSSDSQTESNGIGG
jgi:hypothetical protein